MKTLKLSYSIISQWQAGKYEEAIATYLGKPFPATPAMELGKLYDQKWNEYIEKTGLADEADLKINSKYEILYRFPVHNVTI